MSLFHMDRWYSWLYRAFAGLSLAVFLSGLWLVFLYRPTAAQAWNDIYDLDGAFTFSVLFRSFHRWSTIVWIVTLIPLAIMELVRRHIVGGVTLTASIGLAAVTAYLGLLLPWDQLALWAFAVGTNMSGYEPILFGDDVRFVLVNSVEVGVSTLRTHFYLHVGLGTLLLVATQFARRRNCEFVQD